MHFAHFLPCNIISKLFSPGSVKVFLWYLYCICGVFVLYLCLIFFLPMLLPLTKHCSLLTYWSCKSALNALQCQVKLELVLIMSTLAFPWFLQLHSCTMYSGTLHVAYLWRYNLSRYSWLWWIPAGVVFILYLCYICIVFVVHLYCICGVFLSVEV